MKTQFFNRLHKIKQYMDAFGIPKKLLFFIIGLSAFSAIGQAVSVGLFVPLINAFQNVEGGAQSNIIVTTMNHIYAGVALEHRYYYILVTLLSLMAVVLFLMIMTTVLIIKFSMFDLQYTVTRKLYKDLLATRLKFFYTQKSGDLINNLTTDVRRCYATLFYLNKIVTFSFVAISYLVVCFIIVPKYTLYLIGIIIVVGFLFKQVMGFLYQLGRKSRVVEGKIKNIIVETLQGTRSIILSSAQKSQFKQFDHLSNEFYLTDFKYTAIMQNVTFFLNFIGVLVIGTVLIVNKDFVLASDPEFLSKILFFIFACGNIFRSLGQIKSVYSSFAFNYGGIEAILELNDQIQTFKEKDDKNLISKNDFNNLIQIKHLTFEYLTDTPILEDISINIEKNQKVAFVGSSGSGKSTLVDIICGFHNDYSGHLLVDEIELKEIRKSDWRNLLGYVSQESFLFNDTVRNNLKFGFIRDVSDEEILEAARKAQLYDSILSFKDGLDTQLGERGVKLSGGEKQRMAIARIFLKNPSIVFLDEATSALDSESETRVKQALDELGKGRTIVAVAHRLSTIKDYDVIYVLEKGRVIESGSHSQLISQGGVYYKYHAMQDLENNYADV